jgi:hypothetical protein
MMILGSVPKAANGSEPSRKVSAIKTKEIKAAPVEP